VSLSSLAATVTIFLFIVAIEALWASPELDLACAECKGFLKTADLSRLVVVLPNHLNAESFTIDHTMLLKVTQESISLRDVAHAQYVFSQITSCTDISQHLSGCMLDMYGCIKIGSAHLKDILCLQQWPHEPITYYERVYKQYAPCVLLVIASCVFYQFTIKPLDLEIANFIDLWHFRPFIGGETNIVFRSGSGFVRAAHDFVGDRYPDWIAYLYYKEQWFWRPGPGGGLGLNAEFAFTLRDYYTLGWIGHLPTDMSPNVFYGFARELGEQLVGAALDFQEFIPNA